MFVKKIKHELRVRGLVDDDDQAERIASFLDWYTHWTTLVQSLLFGSGLISGALLVWFVVY